MSGPKSDRSAYRKALRWKKNPLHRNRAQVSKNGKRKTRDVWTVRYPTEELRPWITQEDITAAGLLAMEKNNA